MSHLLLAGGGHSHALLLRQWAMRPSTRPAVEAITLVSAQSTSLYSGLIPACLSGSVAPEACVLDLWGLCRAAAVSFVQATATGLDIANRQLSLTGDRPPLSYDWLSLNLGAEVRAPKRPGCLPIKPLEPVLVNTRLSAVKDGWPKTLFTRLAAIDSDLASRVDVGIAY